MQKLLNMLGLCARAGRLTTGEKACLDKIRSGGAYVALLDGASAKNAVKIPVVANGDITDAEQAKKVLEMTGCDGVMIGRASQGNPYIFTEIKCFMEGKPFIPVSPGQKREDIKKHISLLIEDKGEYVGVREARKHVAWYIKGVDGAASLRNRVNLAESRQEVMAIIDEAFGA